MNPRRRECGEWLYVLSTRWIFVMVVMVSCCSVSMLLVYVLIWFQKYVLLL